eukprot:COSAG04_NODE_130_length_24323_cov_50.932835_40_plen_99_part_00
MHGPCRPTSRRSLQPCAPPPPPPPTWRRLSIVLQEGLIDGAAMAQAYKADGIPGCLDEVFRITKPYMPPYYLEEQRGLAAGSVRTRTPPCLPAMAILT